MGSSRQRNRSGIVSIAAALLAVLAWWVLIVPGISWFKAYKHKMEITARLNNIVLPRGARLVRMDRTKYPTGTQWAALGVYLVDIECDAVITHYKEQFSKQGFALTEEKEDAQKHEKNLTFVASNYQAILTCESQKLPQPYTILIWPTQFHSEGSLS